ncbi:ANTAR domain-containing protein [Saccharothrix australiensis]|uniref:ANTAR domain-containing protein n=1 Tax=Saccharothrix australiensis TaxID=2072 RepID=A0A495VXX7_9PSEU|nr:ANTAR domain-containing protein [Saccharothrix australiensis]
MDGQRRDRLARVVAEHVASPGRTEWARALCEVCVHALAGVDATAVTLRSGHRAQELLASSDRWAGALEEAQYTVGEGPGVEAFGTGGPVLVADLSAARSRWPGFADLAEEEGLAAVFAFPLRLGGTTLGTLDLYRRRPGGLSPTVLGDAAVLADLTVLWLLDHSDTTGGGVRVEVSYQDVNIATGMLAAQLRISLEDAFARLRAHAFASRRSVLDVARDVLARRLPLDQLAD